MIFPALAAKLSWESPSPLSICTSLAVLASVQRRKIRYLLIALAIYIVYANAPVLFGQSLSDLQTDVPGPLLTRFSIEELWRLPLALLTPWLIFRLRKTMTTSDTP